MMFVPSPGLGPGAVLGATKPLLCAGLLTMDGSVHREHIHTTPGGEKTGLGGKKTGVHVAMHPILLQRCPMQLTVRRKFGGKALGSQTAWSQTPRILRILGLT